MEVAFGRRRSASPAFVTDTPVVADFLEVGLLAAWRAGPAERAWRFRMEAGPQVGILLRARRRFRDVDQDITDELQHKDLKAVLGVRVERRAGGGWLVLGTRFAWGLTDLDTTNQQQIRARIWVFLLGYER
jgi:hypothetical protein